MSKPFPNSKNPKPSTSISEETSLPTDLWIEILKRLPLKSLVRSTCVCKSWFSILKSPTFLSVLANFNLRNDSGTAQKSLLFKDATDIHDAHAFTTFPVYNYTTVALTKQITFLCEIGRNHFVVSSADGLVCLFDFYCQNPENSPLIFWNPSIRKGLIVPIPDHVDGLLEFTLGGFPKLIFGLGFDSSSDGYMAVRVAYYNGRGVESQNTLFRVHVYNVSDCTWKDLGKIPVPQYITTIRWRGVCLNGVIHWICNVSVNSDASCPIQRSILTFNLGNEQFGEIKLPKELVDVADETLRVVMVPRDDKEVLGVVKRLGNVCSLWVMEEYGVMESWVELFSVNFESAIKNDMNMAVLSDRYVVAQTKSGGWVSYDHKTKQVQHLKMELSEGLDFVDTYVENLILLGQQNGALPAEEVNKVNQVHTKAGRACRGRKRKARAL